MNTKNQRTYDSIFQHPMTHNLEWRDVRSLAEEIGKVEDEHNGNVKLSLEAKDLTFHSPVQDDLLGPEQVMQLRHLLSEFNEGPPERQEFHVVLVMDHKEASIYQTELKGAIPERVVPYDPSGQKRHVHSHHDYSDHMESTSQDAYFKAIATSLAGADRIVILGSGEGSSNAMNNFRNWLKQNNELLSSRVTDCVKVDMSHMTEGQVLQKARELYK